MNRRHRTGIGTSLTFLVSLSLLFASPLGVAGCGADPAPADLDGGGGGGGDPDGQPPSTQDPGGACDCDADCKSVDGHDGICVFGVCMTRASGACSSAGSQAECPAGSRCWGLQGVDGSICWPDCSAHGCAGTCDNDGSCAPDASSDCRYSCSTYCACQQGDCAAGEQCVSGACVPLSGDAPGAGPGPDCPNLPQRDCTGGNAHCSQLVQFDPAVTPHYEDYPINGETWQNQYRSWLRRDLRMLVDYATAKTLCKAGDWATGNGGPLGLGDMSEMNGAIPGTSVGQPGHPQNTHTNGPDIDLAYYQIGQQNNRLRSVCPHVQNGQDQYHCVGEPHILDVWRTALFLGFVFESPRVRVIGVDGKVGPLVVSALGELCALGWLEPASCGNVALAYETTNTGQGWFRFHHHHAHISLKTTSYAPAPGTARPMECKHPPCDALPVKPNPLWDFAR
jgi:hypothetical protein